MTCGLISSSGSIGICDFRDVHAIDKVDSEGDMWINIKQWFDRQL